MFHCWHQQRYVVFKPQVNESEQQRRNEIREIEEMQPKKLSRKSKYQVQKKESEKEKSEKTKRLMGKAFNSE